MSGQVMGLVHQTDCTCLLGVRELTPTNGLHLFVGVRELTPTYVLALYGEPALRRFLWRGELKWRPLHNPRCELTPDR